MSEDSGGRRGPEKMLAISMVQLGPFDQNGCFVGDPGEACWPPRAVEVPVTVWKAVVEGLAAERRKCRRSVIHAVLLPVLVVVACLAGLAAFAGSEPLPATVTVIAPSKALPEGMATREIRVEQLEPLQFREFLGVVADKLGVEAALEERPGRVAGGELIHDEPVPFGLVRAGKVRVVLDELARLSGYDWTWSGGRLVFFRYGDIEQRRASTLPGGVSVDVLAALAEREAGIEAAQVEDAAELGGRSEELVHEGGETSDAEVDSQGRLAAGVPGKVDAGRDGRLGPEAGEALEGQGEAAPAEPVPAQPAGWQVDPERHQTVEEVLRSWAERAGWSLAWESEKQFRIGAAAEFKASETEEAGFLEAADALLAIAPMRRTLAATAFPNKWLVIQDVGSLAR